MPVPSPARVSVRDLTKRYGDDAVLAGLSLEANEGEIFGLVGPNGAGKTTLLECILGLRQPDSGAILVGGVDALRYPEKSKEFVGAQLQAAALQDKITPRQALRFFGSFYADPFPVDELITRFALVEKADTSFEALSGGQKQRLFLALAFVNRPRLVVLDEPTAGLDPQTRRELHRLIIQMREAGGTVLFSTHDLREAEQLCDRIGMLDRGQLVAVGSPRELTEKARALPRLIFRTSRPVSESQLAALPGVVVLHRLNDGWTLGSRGPNATLVGLVSLLDGAELLDLEIKRPSLEDVYFEQTGRSWSAEAQP